MLYKKYWVSIEYIHRRTVKAFKKKRVCGVLFYVKEKAVKSIKSVA